MTLHGSLTLLSSWYVCVCVYVCFTAVEEHESLWPVQQVEQAHLRSAGDNGRHYFLKQWQ